MGDASLQSVSAMRQTIAPQVLDYLERHHPPLEPVLESIRAEGLATISALQEKVLHHPHILERLVADFSIHVTEMFRDPSFFLAFRRKAVPLLRAHPYIRIWHAGCSTGEEVLSMAILLQEEGLYHKTRIYATDMNEKVLERAKLAVFPLEKMQLYTKTTWQPAGKKRFPNITPPKRTRCNFIPL